MSGGREIKTRAKRESAKPRGFPRKGPQAHVHRLYRAVNLAGIAPAMPRGPRPQYRPTLTPRDFCFARNMRIEPLQAPNPQWVATRLFDPQFEDPQDADHQPPSSPLGAARRASRKPVGVPMVAVVACPGAVVGAAHRECRRSAVEGALMSAGSGGRKGIGASVGGMAWEGCAGPIRSTSSEASHGSSSRGAG